MGCRRQCHQRAGRVCRAVVELSIVHAEFTRPARVWICARVVSGSRPHSRGRSGGRRGRRVRDTTTMIRHICATVTNVYLVLLLVKPSIDLNDDEIVFFCSGSGKNVRRRGCSWPCVLANVGTHHHRNIGQVRGSRSRSHIRMNVFNV